ncbi:sodium/hydrogen exchanger 4 isoform X2 [Lingula anatina]|uniref:Sodium/hydrogen exchanger 4 isoform X2 n=1 Tax=Lingula anatina TaxID=7574 RepID=A0A1S3J501_LINAN|nr:sodium/hydrogen exchanger 4 isoform X2 [Lingula anatina]|eukprot:XP_013405512.1 sodium/hydrogen exchanger 4 isoform X2 [Lingula anatina]
MLNENDVPRFRAFLTTTLVVIIFTVFIQGGTIKPLVKLLQIKKKKNKVVSMSEEINYHVTDHVLAGIEEIMGTHGDHWLRESVNRLDLQYLKKWLQNNPQRHDEQIMELFQEIALRQHYENVAGTEAAKRWASSIDIAPEFEGDEPPKSPSPEALKDLLHEYMHVTTAILHRTTDLEKSDREKLAQRIRSGSGGSLDFNHELHVPTVPRPSLPFLAVRSATIASNASDDYEDILENAAMLEHPDLLRNAPDTVFPGSPRRRLSTSASAKFIPNPKPSDLRKMLVKAPSRALHAKANKNLVREDSQDLVHQLHEKQLRQNRYRRAMSVSFSPSGSPLLPRSVKGAARQAAFTAKLRRQHSEPSPEKEVVDGVHDERKRVTLPPERSHHMEAIEESEESETEDTKGEKPKGNGEAKVPFSEAEREADVRAERAKTRRVQKAYSLGDTPKDSAMFDLGRGESEEAQDTFPEETEMVELPKKDASETEPMLTKSATDTALIKRGQETKVDIEDSSSETDNGKTKPMAEKRRRMRKLQRKGAMDDPKV